MTREEMILSVQREIASQGDTLTDDELRRLVSSAERHVLNHLYPYDDSQTEVPPRYMDNVHDIAVYLWGRRGGEGELSHDENGIRRTYASAYIPRDFFRGIVPYCGVPM